MSIVLNGLAKKYQELAGEADSLLAQVEAIRKDQDALKAAIKVLDPDYKIAGKPTKRRTKNKFFAHGESTRFVLDQLREASAPISTIEMAHLAAKAKGFELDQDGFRALTACMLTALSRQRINGVVKEAGRCADGTIKWRLP